MSKKFLSLEGLQKYDLLIKQELAKKAEADHNHNDMYYTESEIDAKLTEVNESISKITSGDVVVPKAEEATHAVSADSATSATSTESATKATQDASGNVIVDTYETKVDASAKLDAAKEYADGKDTAIAEAKQAGVDAASAAGVAQAAADKAQGDVDDLKTYVGTIPAGATATDIVGYVQEKTAGIASEGAMTELSNRVGVVEGKVGTIEGDYLKKADKEELQGNINAVSDKVATLIDEDVNKSVRTIANEELAKQLIAEGAQESLDTLAEIAAWIQAHPADAAAMNKAIDDLEALVGTLPEGITATTVVGYIAEVKAALEVEIGKDRARLDALEAIDHEHKNFDLLETYTQTEANLADAVAKKHAHSNFAVLEGITSDKVSAWDAAEQNAKDYVDGEITDVKTELQGELATAIEGVMTDAANQDAVVLVEAQRGIAAVQEALDAHVNGGADIHVTLADKTKWNAALQASDITVGGANGTIAVKGADVAVKGLGSAAFVETTAFDASGAANQALVDAKAYTDAAVAEFEEVSEEEINGLFA